MTGRIRSTAGAFRLVRIRARFLVRPFERLVDRLAALL